MNNIQKCGKPNPQNTASFISLLFVWWTKDLFRNARDGLKLGDLYDPIKSEDSEILGDRLEREWNRELKKLNRSLYTKGTSQAGKWSLRGRPCLKRALFRTFFWENLSLGLLQTALMVGSRLSQPVFQEWIVNYYKVNSEITKRSVIYYAIGLILSTLIGVFLLQHVFSIGLRLGMRARIACCSLMYSKVLRLSKSVIGKTAAGQVVNLMSNDVSRFDFLPVYFNYIWIMPIQVSIACYFMWDLAGIAAIVGVFVMILLALPFQLAISRISDTLRGRVAAFTDKRIQFMNELVAGIQVVKMYAWGKPFQKLAMSIRADEMKPITQASHLLGITNTFSNIMEKCTIFVVLIIFVSLGHTLTAEISFTVTIYFKAIHFTINTFLPMCFILYGQASASVRRIEEFLLLDELNSSDFKIIGSPLLSSISSEEILILKSSKDCKPILKQNIHAEGIGIELVNVYANWNIKQSPATLSNLSLKVDAGTICAITGSVGSGKTAILNLLLKELNLENGAVIFYKKFKHIVHSDFRSGYYTDTPHLQISYASQDIWLFSGTVRENILFGQPYDSDRYAEVTEACALLRDFQQLPNEDQTIIGERGASLSGGQRARINLARAVYRSADVYLLDDPLSAVDSHVAQFIFRKCIQDFLTGKTRIIVTHNVQFLRRVNSIAIIEEGTVKDQGTPEELTAIHENNFHLQKSKSNGFDRTWSVRLEYPEDHVSKDASVRLVNSAISDYAEEDMEHGNLRASVYFTYLKAGGSWLTLLIYMIVVITSNVTLSGSDYWISYWTNFEEARAAKKDNISNDVTLFNRDSFLTTKDSIYIYSFLIGASVVFFIIRNYLLIRICMTASINLHKKMFTNVLNATMSFFNDNSSGRILNRFSKDMGTVDELLPRAIMETLQIFLLVLAIFILVSAMNFYMVIPLVIICLLLYYTSIDYRNTVHSLKRLEGVAKSPVFSHVNTTMNGLITIRSSGKDVEKKLRKQFHSYQNIHTGAWHLIIAAGTAFGLFVDLLCCFFTGCVVFSIIIMFDTGEIPGGDVGLMISQSLTIVNVFQYGMKQAAEFLTYMTSVERIIQYTNLPQEQTQTYDERTPENWPLNGQLELKHVSMAYKKEKPLILKDLDVTIEAGWKVGIVGRTGAGKSSLISALFRLADSLEGEIIIDGLDTKAIDLQKLRSRISIIPQEPILFSEKLRYNLDPFGHYADAALLETLQIVELGNMSLNMQVAERGSNFSVGQRQLICLARAILRNNRILILDEATANIDTNTESLIQKTIRKTFARCTVLTIAHRLSTIMDSDRIIVMDNGRIAEFGSPHILLQDNPDGFLSKMVNQTGSEMSLKLRKVAEASYFKSLSNISVSTDEHHFSL